MIPPQKNPEGFAGEIFFLLDVDGGGCNTKLRRRVDEEFRGPYIVPRT